MAKEIKDLQTVSMCVMAHNQRTTELEDLQLRKNEIKEEFARNKNDMKPEELDATKESIKQIDVDMQKLRREISQIDIRKEELEESRDSTGSILEVEERSSFLETQEAEEVFGRTIQNSRDGKQFTNNWEQELQARGITWTGGMPVPKTVDEAIKGALKKYGTIYNLVAKDWGNEGRIYLFKTNEDLGKGDNRQNKDTSKTQGNMVFDKVEVDNQFIYEFIDVDRVDLKKISSLMGFIKNELPKIIVKTIERAIMIKTGTSSDDTFIYSIQPIAGASIEYTAEVVANEIDENTIDDLKAKIDAPGEKFLVGSKDDFTAFRKVKNAMGTRVYDFRKKTINGIEYDTIDGYVYIEVDYISSTEMAAPGNYSLVMAVLAEYKLIGESTIVFYQDNINDKNKERYMVEQYVGGAPNELKMAAVLKKGTGTGTLSVNSTMTPQEKKLVKDINLAKKETEAAKKELEVAKKELEAAKKEAETAKMELESVKQVGDTNSEKSDE